MAKRASKTVPSRYPNRSTQDPEQIYAILDDALICTVSYCIDNQPFSIPTAFVREGNKVFVHGSVGSHFIREIEKGIPVCISVMHTDAIVVAKSAFNHSFNYRSVVIFSKAQIVDNYDEKVRFLEGLTNKIVPNSFDYLRTMKPSEVQKTTVLAFEIEEASAKTRTGMSNDDEDVSLWSGIIPLETRRLAPIPDPGNEWPLPAHLQ